MKDKRTRKRDYTEEFKPEAVRLVLAVGVNEADCRLGVPTATIGSWARRVQQGGCGQNLGLIYVARPKCCRYSIGLIAPSDSLIRRSLYQRI